jgi:hypothetical protein
MGMTQRREDGKNNPNKQPGRVSNMPEVKTNMRQRAGIIG